MTVLAFGKAKPYFFQRKGAIGQQITTVWPAPTTYHASA